MGGLSRTATAILGVALFSAGAAPGATPSVPSRELLKNGGFESGLSGWQCTGAVTIESNSPVSGKGSVRIGPGRGSVSQRIWIGPENHMTISALLRSSTEARGTLTVRFLDKDGNELMRISRADMKEKDGKLSDYFKPHPLTASIEVEISNEAAASNVIADDVGLTLSEDDRAPLTDTQSMAELMKPFWRGNTVFGEGVLMQSAGSEGPATGTLMFVPTRIESVTSYDGTVQYRQGIDYRIEGRTLITPSGSRMPAVSDAVLLKGELAWNVLGGKQVLVTYEHSDAWPGPA